MTWCRQATSHYLDQCFAKFVCHYRGANELTYSQTFAELTDFYLVVCMASNLIFRKQRYSGRRRSYIYPTWQCRIAISSTLIRGLCRQVYSFALATPLCFADHAVKQSVMHAPGYSHHGINSYKGRHKQRNFSKRFPIYRLHRPTRLHRNRRRHTPGVTHKNSPGRDTRGRTRRVSFRLSRCGDNTWIHRPHTGNLWSGGFGLCRWLRTGNLTSSGNTSVLWIHFY